MLERFSPETHELPQVETLGISAARKEHHPQAAGKLCF